MHFATSKQVQLITALFFLLLLSLPKAFAADLPLMTWERGKVQNVVLGGAAVPENWQLELSDGKNLHLKFDRSNPNKKGFVVYSIYIPNNFKEGSYFVTVVKSNKIQDSIVAGINVIPMQSYEITKMPRDLKMVIFFLGILITVLSTSRARKYQDLSFLRVVLDEESPTYLEKIAKRKFSTLALASIFREKTSENSRVTLLEYFGKRNDAFIQKLSPHLYKFFPIISVFLGLLGGTLGASSHPDLPYFVFVVFLLLGFLDIRSAFLASLAYISMQIILGNATSMNSLFALSFALLGVTCSSLVGEICRELIKIDWENGTSPRKLKAFAVSTNLISASMAGFFFVISTLIKQSLSGKSIQQYETIYFLAFSVFLVTISKFYIYDYLDNWVKGSRKLVRQSFRVIRPINPLGVSLYMLAIFTLGYSWSQRVTSAIIIALTLSLPVALLLIPRTGTMRFSMPNKIPNNIVAECVLVFLLTYALIQVITLQPMAVLQRSEVTLLVAFSIVTLHALVFSFLKTNSIECQEIIA